MGVAMTTHFCDGHAVKSKLAIGKANLDCGMADMDTDCKDKPKNGLNVNTKPCCNNQSQTLETDDYKNSGEVLIKFNVDFAIAFVQSFFKFILFTEVPKTSYISHPPPYSEKNIQVLFQIFLI
jgi:hypothetical protein